MVSVARKAVRTVYEAPARGVRLNITMVLGHCQLAVLAVGVRLGQVCEASLVVAAPEEPAADQERLPKLDEEVKRGAALSACEEVCAAERRAMSYNYIGSTGCVWDDPDDNTQPLLAQHAGCMAHL